MGDWKVVLIEPRAKQLMCWFEPFVKLRAPKMVNLRHDPFERANENSNTYWDWVISHAYIIYGMQAVVAQQIEAFAKFPPRQIDNLSGHIETSTVPGYVDFAGLVALGREPQKSTDEITAVPAPTSSRIGYGKSGGCSKRASIENDIAELARQIRVRGWRSQPVRAQRHYGHARGDQVQ
jgi:hypothetical protein